MNLYAYVGNDPVNATDPTGKWIHLIVRAAQIGYKAYKQYKNTKRLKKSLKRMESNKPAKLGDPRSGEVGGPGAGKRISEKTKSSAESRDGGTCVFCKKETNRTQGSKQQRNADHAQPKSRNGNNSENNTQNTCQSCNNQKSDRASEEFIKDILKGEKLKSNGY